MSAIGLNKVEQYKKREIRNLKKKKDLKAYLKKGKRYKIWRH